MSESSRGIEIVKQQGQNGVSITVGGESLSTQGKPLDVQINKQQSYVYLAIDCSGSMHGYKLDQAKQGVLSFATDALKNDYRVGLISFDTEAKIICEPVSDIQILTPGVRAMRVGGSTNMVKAIKLAHDKLKVLEGTRVIVFATDGMPDNVNAALKAAQSAKDDGIDFIAIGTDDANQNFLGNLATRQDLAAKVSSDMFAQAIASASNLLPPPQGIIKRQ
jgi:Mg-chelatase subunit ChlD